MASARELLLTEQARARQRIAALEREFAGLAEAASAAGTDDEHDPEGATLAFERQHTAALLEAAHEQVAAIDAALAKLTAGRYGGCERCGQPIGAGRLAARPTATTCINCAAGRRTHTLLRPQGGRGAGADGRQDARDGAIPVMTLRRSRGLAAGPGAGPPSAARP